MQAKRLGIIAVLVLVTFILRADEPAYLINSESPEGLEHLVLQPELLLGLELGYIPTILAVPSVGIGLFDFLILRTEQPLAFFLNQVQFRWTGLSVSAKLDLAVNDDVGLFPYLRYKQLFGTPLVVPYTGGQENVYLVLSPHTDRGLDLSAGLAGRIGFGESGFALLFDANYTRIELRDYTAEYLGEGYRNRVFLNATPALYPAFDGNRPLMLGLQNRFVIWFARGFSYDVMPQVTWELDPIFDMSLGVNVPVVGGGTYAGYLAGRIRLDLKEIKIPVRIVTADLFFPPNSAELFSPAYPEKAEKNREIIRRLARDIEPYPDYLIRIEGHTSWVYWDDPEKGPIEQEEVLIPLSKARAEAVKAALTDLGISASRMSTEGMGGSNPVVPFDNADEQWRNRRVEIILYKE